MTSRPGDHPHHYTPESERKHERSHRLERLLVTSRGHPRTRSSRAPKFSGKNARPERINVTCLTTKCGFEITPALNWAFSAENSYEYIYIGEALVCSRALNRARALWSFCSSSVDYVVHKNERRLWHQRERCAELHFKSMQLGKSRAPCPREWARERKCTLTKTGLVRRVSLTRRAHKQSFVFDKAAATTKWERNALMPD